MDVLAHGIEIELPIIKYGAVPFDAEYFLNTLQGIWQDKGYPYHLYTSNGRVLELTSKQKNTTRTVGFDSVYSTLEIAVGPYPNLAELHTASAELYNDAINCAKAQDACIINFSEMPNQSLHKDNYANIALKSPYFSYVTKHRNLSYNELADSKSQISPCSGVDPIHSIKALNLILKLSPIFIALYANSPYENCIDTHHAENRLRLWQRVFSTSVFENDVLITKCPENFFTSIHHYIKCMYGNDFPCYAISKNKDTPYKKNDDLFILKEAPNMINFLRKDCWDAYAVSDGKECTVKPNIADFFQQQFAYFIDARLRFDFNNKDLQHSELLKAYDKGAQYFDDFFIDQALHVYIENRVPGSQCPDISLKNSPKEVQQSVHMAVVALQTGILRNIEAIENYLHKINFEKKYSYFRELAITKGLHGELEGHYLFDIIKNIVKLAEDALTSHEVKLLSYIKYILYEKQNCADKARKLIKEQKDQLNIDWEYVCINRKALQI